MEQLFVVGLASSAGGVPALIELLEHASCHHSMCFVVVSHLPCFYTSNLDLILQRASKLHAQTIFDGLPLKHCGLYVIPNNAYVEIKQGQFKVSVRPAQGVNTSANHFFSSLAREYGQNAIGVVLSGAAAGADGKDGCCKIKEAGGHTYAQDPMTAEFASMPQLAIWGGCVDSVLSAELIGKELALVSWAAQHSRS